MKSKTLTYCFITIALSSLPVIGRSQSIDYSDRIAFHQGKSVINKTFNNNRATLDSLTILIDSLSNDIKNYSIDRIVFTGTASPEGSASLNDRLSHARAMRVASYLQSSSSLNKDMYELYSTGRDWNGLYRLVAADNNTPSQHEALEIISSILESVKSGNPEPADKLTQLYTLENGKAYKYMYRTMFPSLRSTYIDIDYTHRFAPITGAIMVSYFGVPNQEIGSLMTVSEPVKSTQKPLYIALKTNLLYDALALPNLGAEFYVGHNVSAGGNWMYGWWDNDKKHRYWRAYGGDLFARYWFGSKANEKPLTGHHVGIFAGVVTYDFELGGKGIMGGLPRRSLWDRCNTIAGIEYGYSLPIARRLNLDFSIAFGYFGGKYIKYSPANGHYIWNSVHRLNWIGPVKAEVSLVWLIGHGNTNAGKGGKL